MSTRVPVQEGLFDKLCHKACLYCLIELPFASHLDIPHHPLAQGQGSSWDLGNAERPSSECPVAGEAHLMLLLLHHLTLRVSCFRPQFGTGFGKIPLQVTVCCSTAMHHAAHTVWGHANPQYCARVTAAVLSVAGRQALATDGS